MRQSNNSYADAMLSQCLLRVAIGDIKIQEELAILVQMKENFVKEISITLLLTSSTNSGVGIYNRGEKLFI